MPLSADQLDRFQQLIYDRSSLRFSSARISQLETQLLARLADLGKPVDEYFIFLQTDPLEMETLIERVTTKETYFFRLPGQFDAMREMVVPELENELIENSSGQTMLGPRPSLRIWSAGCATGEEPYSAGMMILSSLRYPRATQVEILATDISHKAVSTASAGIYDYAALGRIPRELHERFVDFQPRQVMMKPALRSVIDFRVFNLAALDANSNGLAEMTRLDGGRETTAVRGRFDIILCRNVMIYFDYQAQQKLISGIYDCLKPGGWFFTGDVELLHIYQHGFQSVEHRGTYFYRKPGAARSATHARYS